MKGMVNTAKLRDEHRAKIDELDTKLGLLERPTHADLFVSNVAAFLGVFGIRPLPESLEAIRSMKSLSPGDRPGGACHLRTDDDASAGRWPADGRFCSGPPCPARAPKRRG
jgi:hypothetical protein